MRLLSRLFSIVHVPLASLVGCAAWIACTGHGLAADNQAYPVRPMRLIVPFAPGGSNDIMARLIGQKFGESFGQQVVVDNRSGASGIIGTELAAKAPPDGYTLLMMSLTIAVNPSLFSEAALRYREGSDAVTLVASAPLMLVVHPSLPAKSVQDLIAYAKANPGKLAFGSGGPGTTPHLAGEMFKVDGRRADDARALQGRWPRTGRPRWRARSSSCSKTFRARCRSRSRASCARSPSRRSSVRRSLPDLPTLDEAGLRGYEIVGLERTVPARRLAAHNRSAAPSRDGESARGARYEDTACDARSGGRRQQSR